MQMYYGAVHCNEIRDLDHAVFLHNTHSLFLFIYNSRFAASLQRLCPYRVFQGFALWWYLHFEESFKIDCKKIRVIFFENQIFFCLKHTSDRDRTDKKIIQTYSSVPEEIGFKHTNIGTSCCYSIKVICMYIIYRLNGLQRYNISILFIQL